MLVAQLGSTLCDPMDCDIEEPAKLLCPWDSLGKNSRVGSHSLLQGIFPNQGSNLSLPHGRQILYHLNHHIGGIIWYLSFSLWLTLLNMIISRSIHSSANDIIHHFIILYGWYIYIHTYIKCILEYYYPIKKSIRWHSEN